MSTSYPNLTTIVAQVKDRMREAFPAYTVTVQSSPDDILVLCVRVFAVPENKIDEVENFVFDLQDSLITKTEVMLLPMVKNLEVTRQHYPEYMLEPAVSDAKMVEQFLLETVRQPNEWQHEKSAAICAADYRTAPERFGSDMGKITGEPLTPTPKYENTVAANTELALAA